MRCALISDVHANKYALAAVLDSIQQAGVDLIVNAGDTFGYYAWPQEVWDMLQPLAAPTVLGNHDRMILGGTCPPHLPFYWDAIEHNRGALCPAALDWLRQRPLELRLCLGSVTLHMMHGTPDDPLEGRLYPNHPLDGIAWLPGPKEVLVLGHTHYPWIVRTPAGGLLLNPGSVGQPRDGNPKPAWILLDASDLTASLIRVEYDRDKVARELRARAWHERAVQALSKTAAPGSD